MFSEMAVSVDMCRYGWDQTAKSPTSQSLSLVWRPGKLITAAFNVSNTRFLVQPLLWIQQFRPWELHTLRRAGFRLLTFTLGSQPTQMPSVMSFPFSSHTSPSLDLTVATETNFSRVGLSRAHVSSQDTMFWSN